MPATDPGHQGLLTDNFGRKSLDGSFTRLGAGALWRLGGEFEGLMKNLKVTEALAGDLSLDLNLLPSSERVGRGPVPEKLAVGVGDWWFEVRCGCLCLDHIVIPVIAAIGLGGAGGGWAVVDGLLVVEIR